MCLLVSEKFAGVSDLLIGILYMYTVQNVYPV